MAKLPEEIFIEPAMGNRWSIPAICRVDQQQREETLGRAGIVKTTAVSMAIRQRGPQLCDVGEQHDGWTPELNQLALTDWIASIVLLVSIAAIFFLPLSRRYLRVLVSTTSQHCSSS
jgi:hypothetical protein